MQSKLEKQLDELLYLRMKANRESNGDEFIRLTKLINVIQYKIKKLRFENQDIIYPVGTKNGN